MKFTVKLLDSRDTDTFRRLLDCFGREFDDSDTYLANQPDDGYLTDLLDGTSLIAIAAQCGNHVIGGLVAYELKKFEQVRSEIYIYDLAVAKAYRRQGVATSLIEFLKPIATRRQAWVIYVQADEGDEPAIKLYSKLGLGEKVLHFDIKPN